MSRSPVSRSIAVLTTLAALLVAASVAMAQPAGRFAYVETFVASDVFYDQCVGFACQPTEQFEAAARAGRDSPDIVPWLESRRPSATPAGKVYIALAIRAHDRAKGEALLRDLARESGTVEVFSGCIRAPQTMKALASNWLQREAFGP